jgi:hypothetical protein
MGSLTGSPIFETVVAMVVVWLLAATLCSGIVELVAKALDFRATNLWHAIGRWFESAAPPPATRLAAARSLTATPAIDAKPGPTQLAQELFGQPGAALAVSINADALTAAAKIDSLNLPAVANALRNIATQPQFAQSAIGRYVANLPATITADDAKFRAEIERWVNAEMAAISKAYRSKIRWWGALVAFAVVALLQLDSVALAKEFYEQPTARAVVIAAAPDTSGDAAAVCPPAPSPTTTSPTAAAETTTTTTPESAFARQAACVKADANRVLDLKLSRWSRLPKSCRDWLLWLLGLGASWAAVAAGAPFWFAVLKRLMSLRGDQGGTT